MHRRKRSPLMTAGIIVVIILAVILFRFLPDTIDSTYRALIIGLVVIGAFAVFAFINRRLR